MLPVKYTYLPTMIQALPTNYTYVKNNSLRNIIIPITEIFRNYEIAEITAYYIINSNIQKAYLQLSNYKNT